MAGAVGLGEYLGWGGGVPRVGGYLGLGRLGVCVTAPTYC